MAAKCSAITREGRPCKGLVRPGNDYCPAHDPSRQEARRRAASKAGKSKPGTEITGLKDQLSDLYTGVLVGVVDPKIGAVCAQIAGARIRLIETERKLRELEELEARIEALEGLQEEQRQGGKRWGT